MLDDRWADRCRSTHPAAITYIAIPCTPRAYIGKIVSTTSATSRRLPRRGLEELDLVVLDVR